MNITEEGKQSQSSHRSSLAHALWSLGNDALWAHRQVIEGHEPDLSLLGRSMKLVEQELIKLDQRS